MRQTNGNSPSTRWLAAAVPLVGLLLGAALPVHAQTGVGLRGEYFNTIDLTGPVEVARTDSTVNFEWSGSPAFGVDSNQFSARWTGKVLAAATANYTFTTVSNNGVRLWVNGVKVIDHWTSHSTATDHSGPVALVAGQKYDVKMEFFDQTGSAVAKLQWNTPGQSAVTIPQSQLFPPATTFVSDLAWTSATNGDGPVDVDKSHDGHTLTINGVKFAKGLGVRAVSDIRYNLAKQYDIFTASIGIDDEVAVMQGSAVFQVWLDGVRVYQSDTLRGFNSARFIRIIVTGKSELRLVLNNGGDGSTTDHGDWADAQLFKGGIVQDPYLSDLDWTFATNGWGPVERDKSNGEQAEGDGVPQSINGRKFAKGLGVHAPSDVRFRLSGQYATFVSWIGIDDEVSTTRGSAVFQVWLDGVKAFESPVLTGSSDPIQVNLNVTGKNDLRLIVTSSDGISYDHGDWGNAQLFRSASSIPPTTPPPTTPPPTTPPPTAPSMPTNLKAVAGNAQVVLTWTAPSGATSYNVYRGLTSGGETSIATGVGTPTFTDTGLTNGKKYFYKVAAVNSVGTSPMSAEVIAELAPPPPGAPTALTATAGEGKVMLSWTGVSGAASYNIYRGTSAGNEAPNAVGSATGTSYTSMNLVNGTQYFFKVAAVNGGGVSAMSNEANATPAPPPPAAPTNLKAKAGDKQIVLTWTGVSGATGYSIFRGTTSGGESATPLGPAVSGTTFTDNGLTNGVALFYKVAAINAGGTGALSGEATATPVPPIPAAPTGLTATPGNAQVTLQWTASAGATSYNIYRGATAGGEGTNAVGSSSTTSFTDMGLPNGPTVFYKVAAVNLGGVSPRSNEASAAPVGPAAAPPAGWVTSSRLLRQSTWGPTPALVDHVTQVGASAFLDEQFNAPMSDYPDALKTTGSIEPLQERFFQNAITGPDQLRQRVAFALSQIFVVSGVKVDDPHAMVPYQKMLLTNAFGNYYDILRAVTLNPAMGDFLDMVQNKKADPVKGLSPNENYAREVLQLFSIGLVNLNPDGTSQNTPTYDQSTIADLARVFTGWTYGDTRAGQPTSQNSPFYDGPMEPVEKYHDTGAKTILGKPIAAGLNTTQDLDAALAIIFNHPNVGPFICKNLIQHLVTSNPSAAYIGRIAAVFANDGAGVRGDLKAVVRAILLDPEAALGQPTSGHLREPALFLTSMLRTLNAAIVDHPFVSDKSEEMAQRIFYAPSVFNYFSPGFRTSTGILGPEFQIFTTATSLIRINFVATLLNGGFGNDVTLDLAPYLADLPNTGALVDRVNFNFMGGLMSQAMRDSIIAAVARSSSNNEKVRTAIYLAVTSSQYQVEN